MFEHSLDFLQTFDQINEGKIKNKRIVSFKRFSTLSGSRSLETQVALRPKPCAPLIDFQAQFTFPTLFDFELGQKRRTWETGNRVPPDLPNRRLQANCLNRSSGENVLCCAR